MGRRFRWWAAVFVVGEIFTACGKKADRPATRPEALAACVRGCIEKTERNTCDQLCGCIVDEMFLANGGRRKDPKLLPEVSTACLERLVAKPTEPASGEALVSPTRAPARRDNPLVLAPTLLTGKGCKNGSRLPRLVYEKLTERVLVPGEKLGWRFPYVWGRPIAERRDVMALSIAPAYSGVTPVMEVFVAARCDSYDLSPVFERMAARGLIELAAQADTVAEVRRGGWKVEQGGPDRATAIVRAMIPTPKGPRRVWLYTTKVAESKSFSVHVAGACPGLEPGSSFDSGCEHQYFGMLEALTAQAPPRPIPQLSP